MIIGAISLWHVLFGKLCLWIRLATSILAPTAKCACNVSFIIINSCKITQVRSMVNKVYKIFRPKEKSLSTKDVRTLQKDTTS